ncbi:type II toxin-antitoxin system RelE/ParE family toxin [Desulforhabdus sp. TSK]|uniref:type II toxin-antitoxin system RelE/ParE family toxin n=1 Tax=Desulforhabdus sp. TSK TaxID=2925014 RepID=UPI00207EB83A|nr:toxin, RelE family protein [Desulforhabdus sp. TSK]
MRYRFAPEAEAELNEAVNYYEECQDGLGLAFAGEVHAAIENICRFPLAWSPFSKNTRRCLLKRFPYGVVYQPKDDQIIVIAVMHLNRKPNYWRRRTT